MHKDDKRDILSAIDTLTAFVGRELEAVKSKLGAVESRLGSVESRLGAVESRLDAVEGRLGAVESELATVKSNLAAFREDTDRRLVRIEARLDEQRQTINALIPVRIAALPPEPAGGRKRA